MTHVCENNNNEAIANVVRLGFVSDCVDGLGTIGVMKFYFDTFMHSRTNEINGVFICDGKKIGHVMEGEQASIEKMWNFIKADNRYQKLNIFEKQNSKIHLYENWTLHIKDGLVMTLLYPECIGLVNEINPANTEEVLGIMHSYAYLV